MCDEDVNFAEEMNYDEEDTEVVSSPFFVVIGGGGGGGDPHAESDVIELDEENFHRVMKEMFADTPQVVMPFPDHHHHNKDDEEDDEAAVVLDTDELRSTLTSSASASSTVVAAANPLVSTPSDSSNHSNHSNGGGDNNNNNTSTSPELQRTDLLLLQNKNLRYITDTNQIVVSVTGKKRGRRPRTTERPLILEGDLMRWRHRALLAPVMDFVAEYITVREFRSWSILSSMQEPQDGSVFAYCVPVKSFSKSPQRDYFVLTHEDSESVAWHNHGRRLLKHRSRFTAPIPEEFAETINSGPGSGMYLRETSRCRQKLNAIVETVECEWSLRDFKLKQFVIPWWGPVATRVARGNWLKTGWSKHVYVLEGKHNHIMKISTKDKRMEEHQRVIVHYFYSENQNEMLSPHSTEQNLREYERNMNQSFAEVEADKKTGMIHQTSGGLRKRKLEMLSGRLNEDEKVELMRRRAVLSRRRGVSRGHRDIPASLREKQVESLITLARQSVAATAQATKCKKKTRN